MKRTLISSGSPYEDVIGFSRAVRVGSFVAVGGTAPIGEDGETVGVGNPAEQTRRCIEIIKAALQEAGASLSDVIRTRTLLTNIEDWKVVSEVRAEAFGDVKPVDTVMEVSSFINPQWLVEMEVDAIVAV